MFTLVRQAGWQASPRQCGILSSHNCRREIPWCPFCRWARGGTAWLKPPWESISDLNVDKPDSRAPELNLYAIAAESTNKEHLHESELTPRCGRMAQQFRPHTELQRTWIQLLAPLLGVSRQPVISAPGALTPSPGLFGHLHQSTSIHIIKNKKILKDLHQSFLDSIDLNSKWSIF